MKQSQSASSSPAPALVPDLLTTIRACLGSVLDALPAPAAGASTVVRLPATPGTVLMMHPYRRSTDLEPAPDRRMRQGHAPSSNGHTTPAKAKAPKARKTPQATYRPRVVYHPTAKAAPTRYPLSETEAAVYRAIRKSPGIAARTLQTTLHLRDGQLWGAIRRLTLARLIRTAAPQ
jgi:hypothetical protein